MIRRLRARPRRSGYTLIELLVVMMILGTILAAVVSIFVSSSNAQVDANQRFQAQQNARLALERLRREAHCAANVLQTGRVTRVTLSLPQGCPGAATAPAFATWCTRSLGTTRWGVYRIAGNPATCTGGTLYADFVTRGDAFQFTPGAMGTLSTLRVDFPVDLTPGTAARAWALTDNLVLRNDTR